MNKINSCLIKEKRLFIMLAAVFFMFSAVAARLFYLQILTGQEHLKDVRASIMRTVSESAPRGKIYDRNGIPLADNLSAYKLKIDLSVDVSGLNDMLLNIIRILDENGEEFVDTFPISNIYPYEFLFSSETAEKRWKTDMGMTGDELNLNSAETLEYFRDKFEIPKGLEPDIEKKLLSGREQIYIQRYRKYNMVTLSGKVGYKTIMKIEEQKNLFPGIFIEAEAERNYPQGEAFSHILGYVGSINDEELKEMEAHGYTINDKIGKIGIEKAFELILRGIDGKKAVEVDASGNRINEIKTSEPQNGGDVYLTIDSVLQNKVFNILKENLKDTVIKSIKSGKITLRELYESMEKGGMFSAEEIESIKKLSMNELIEKISSDELKINELNVDPCTGSVVVMDVNTGEVLALVSFPSYDNNQLVNEFNNEYYQKLLKDSTTPLINRPLMERKAPGSVLKMTSAIAGLETGVINENTVIYDKGIYKDAGKPYAKCLIYSRYGATHGATDVRKAIEVSCNYFFYELAYHLGNSKEGTTLDSIEIFDEYMEKFGLNDYSGIEIEESKPKMATPEAKKNAVELNYPDAAQSQKEWMDGDSIRCAIGQSYNSFSAVNIAKYIATLANGGTRYKTTILKAAAPIGESIMYNSAVIEEELGLNEKNTNAVKEGMYLVTHGSLGSLRNHFKSFPIEVAAKTGTAEEANSRPSHSWFAGFAPYDNPQIAVVVMIPFGESEYSPSINTAKQVIGEYFGINREPDTSGMFINKLAE